ncbi:MAG: TIGR03936 family radical SAM-associated protein [Acidimicrobiales bacterium]
MDDAEAANCGPVTVSLPSLRVDAFGVDIAAQLQRAKRSGLTFAPEAGTWRMRQIINKLIREEDLYEAVDAAYSQGWQRVKLYFLTGLPSETDPDTLGIAELAKNCVEIGKKHNKRASVTASVGGFVPKPFTLVPVVRPEHHRGTPAQDQPAARIHPQDEGCPAQVARRPSHTRRRHRGAAATAASATSSKRLAGRRHLSEWTEFFDLERWTPRPWPTPGSIPTGTSTGTAPKTSTRRGPSPRPDSTGTSSGRTGKTPSPRSVCLIADGPRATTAEPAPATASSTSSRHATRRWQPGAPGRICRPAVPPRWVLSPHPARFGEVLTPHEDPPALREERQGAFHQPSDVARLFRASLSESFRLPVLVHRGFSPRPKLSFGLALSVAHESDAEYLDVDLATSVDLGDFCAQMTAALPDGLDVVSAVPLRSGSVSLQQAIVACSWEIEVIGLPPSVAVAVASIIERHRTSAGTHAEGKVAVVDVRPPFSNSRFRGPTDRGVRLAAVLATESVSLRPAELVQLIGPDVEEGRVRRTHQWTSVEPERSEPIGRTLVTTGQPHGGAT